MIKLLYILVLVHNTYCIA